MALKKASVSLLASIATAMAAEPFYALATEKEAKELIDGKLAEFNPEIRDGDKIAIRLTDEGLKANSEMNASTNNTADTGNTGTASAAASSFAIIDNAALPSAARGGRNGPVYPFDDLNVGQSFFVPATADKPEPAKSIASTATSAAKRFATPVKNPDGSPVMEEYKVRGVTKTREKFEFTRRFAVKSVEKGKTYGAWTAPENGALVQRVA
jgi:hypothetical protein